MKNSAEDCLDACKANSECAWWVLIRLLLITVGLNRTGHMSFFTGQDRTPKFAGQVLPDRTKSGLIFYIPNNRISMKFFKLKQTKKLRKKEFEKKFEIFFEIFFFLIFRSFKSPASGKENVRFPDSPDFENSPDFRTGRDVRLSPTSKHFAILQPV